MFFAQTVFMLLGGAALVEPDAARPLFLALLTGYELLYLVRLGQTPGKDLLHLKVVGAAGLAAPAPGRAVARCLPLLAAAASPDLRVTLAVLAGIASVAVLDGRHRGLHDLLAGTRVIRYDADREEALEPVDLDPLERLRRDRRFR